MDIVQSNGHLRLFSNFQQSAQIVSNIGNVDAVKNVRRVVAVPTQIAGGSTKVARLPILGQHFKSETMVDVLHNPVDGTCQLVLLV